MNKRNDELDLIIKILSEMFPEFKVKYNIRSAQSTNAQGGQWMDISSAPKDETEILLYAFKPGVFHAGWEQVIVGRYQTNHFRDCYTGDELTHVTHWMPRPKSPTPPSEG